MIYLAIEERKLIKFSNSSAVKEQKWGLHSTYFRCIRERFFKMERGKGEKSRVKNGHKRKRELKLK